MEQGSISGEEFEQMLDYYSDCYHLIGADEYLYKAVHGILREDDVCVTFDDNLLCQYDIAIPILNKRNLSAFYFAYTSPLEGKAEKLEIYRHFRHLMFPSIDDFYDDFFITYNNLKQALNVDTMSEEKFDGKDFLSQYKFYTLNDKKFRYYRDKILGQEKYYELMDHMISERGYDIGKYSKILWCGKKELKDISSHGHILGIHSHTHPTLMCELDYAEQLQEYSTCKTILEECIGKSVFSASYPCGSTNQDTEKIMKTLNIEVAFKEIMIPFKSNLMIPRQDHTNIRKEMLS